MVPEDQESKEGVLALHDLGGQGPALLISHATGFTGRSYEPFAAALRPHFHVWAVDHRGHGHTGPPPDGDLGWEAMAADLLDAVDAIGPSKPFIYGHSMGGVIALLAARARRDAFAAAYLYEPAVIATHPKLQDEIDAFTAGIRRRRETFESAGDALGYFAVREPYRRFRVDALMAYVTDAFESRPDGSLRLRCSPSVEADCYARNVITGDRFAALRTPIVIACGADDYFGAGLVPPVLARALPHAELRVLDQLGHFGPFEAPEIAAHDLIEALVAVDGRAEDGQSHDRRMANG